MLKWIQVGVFLQCPRWPAGVILAVANSISELSVSAVIWYCYVETVVSGSASGDRVVAYTSIVDTVVSGSAVDDRVVAGTSC